MRLGASLLVAGVLAIGPAAAATPKVESWEIEPGTTAALVEDHRAPLVFLTIEFPAGTWSPWDRTSHATDAFEAQIYDSKAKLRAEIDRLGATLDLASGPRASRLEASCLKENVAALRTLVREILANRDLDHRELTRRKRTRDLEYRASLKEPFFVGIQAAARALFQAGDPRRIDWEKPEPAETDVERLLSSRDTLVRLPGRIVAFAGDLSRQEADDFARELLPPVASSAPPDLAPAFLPLVPQEERKPDTTVHLPRLTQAYFAYARESVSFTDPDYPAFLLADHVLGGHFYSRLFVALRHEGGETYGAATSNRGDVTPGLYGLGTFTRTPNAAATEAKLREVLRVLHDGGITEAERSDAAGYLRGRLAYGRQSPDDVLSRWLRERRLGLEEGFLDRVSERAASLPLEEINAFIARYYVPERFSMVKVAPEN